MPIRGLEQPGQHAFPSGQSTCKTLVSNMTNFETALIPKITDAFRELLSTKHLYQHVKTGDDIVTLFAQREFEFLTLTYNKGSSSRRPPAMEIIVADHQKEFDLPWIPTDWKGQERMVTVGLEKAIEFPLPKLKIWCRHCKAIFPAVPSHVHVRNSERQGVQWFAFAYQCAACDEPPVQFFVKRNSVKLTLCGRDPIGEVRVPRCLPKNHISHFQAAVIAHQCGQTLSAIFMLRTFVEQFWRSIPDVAKAVGAKSRPTGDEMSTAYKATLPASFSQQIPSLGKVYDDLSACIHSADPNEAVFLRSARDVETHFDALKLARHIEG